MEGKSPKNVGFKIIPHQTSCYTYECAIYKMVNNYQYLLNYRVGCINLYTSISKNINRVVKISALTVRIDFTERDLLLSSNIKQMDF